MQRNIQRVVLVAISVLISAGLTDHLIAQEREVPLDTLGQAIEPGGEFDLQVSDFRISGFGVANYAYQARTENNTFAAFKFAISAFKRAGPYVSFFGQLTSLFESHEEEGSGEELGGTQGTEAHAEEGEPVLETEIDNLIISVTPPGASELLFWLGRYDAPLGFERDDEPLNFQPTFSFNFQFARPVKFTGFLARYVPLPELAISGLLVNGWDVTLDNNKGKTVGGRVTFLPQDFAAVSVTSIYGPEKPDNTDDKRFLISSDFTAQPVRPLILGGEFNYGSEQNSGLDGGDAKWIGGVVTSFVRFARHFGVTLRADVLDDRDGSRTGAVQTLQSYTVAPTVFYRSAVAGIFSTIPQTRFQVPEFQFRAGVRYNRSNQAYFPADDGLDKDEVVVVVEGVYVY